MKRRGIFGGSFNPIHLGHLVAAQDALEGAALDQVVFVPAARPPHKPAAPLAPAGDRLAMIRLAIAGDDRFDVSDVELQRGGISFTIDTVQAFRRQYPGVEWSLIIGADTLFDLRNWREIGAILELVRIVVVARPGFAVDTITVESVGLPDPWPGRLAGSVITGHSIGISSSEIRRRIAEGRSIRYLVPDAVERYIRERSLYQEKTASTP